MIYATTQRNTLALTLPATLPAVDQACVEIRAWLTEWELGRLYFEVTLLAREALINAIVHGCAKDPAKEVQFTITRQGDDLVMVVEDPGPGFDWKRQIHRLVDLAKEHGRGMLIFRSYAAAFTYNDKGNRLTIRKAAVR
jgi:serine/threonine-protein kinase RsbW